MSGVGGQGLQEAGEGLRRGLGRGSGTTAQRAGLLSRGRLGHLRPETRPRPSGSVWAGRSWARRPRGWPPRAPSGSGQGPGGEGMRRRCALQPHRGGGPSRPRPAALTLHRRGARADGGAPAVWPRVSAPLLSAAPLVSAAPPLRGAPLPPPLTFTPAPLLSAAPLV